MHTSNFLIFASATLATVSTAIDVKLFERACAADNCYNAIKASSRTTACSAFQRTTVTPCSVTVTKTYVELQTNSPTTTCAGPAVTSSTATPTYASKCSGTLRYASACSCLGVPKTTITLAANTTTFTSYTTASCTPSIPAIACPRVGSASVLCGANAVASGATVLFSTSGIALTDCQSFVCPQTLAYAIGYQSAGGLCTGYGQAPMATLRPGSDFAVFVI